nr:hypothetical protein [Tanacetum cinerariifolium]
MVLSSTYSMPPKQYPPSVLESLAVIAENLSKLVDTMTINNEKLAASQFKLNVAIKNLFATQNARLSAIITKTAKPENNMVKYFPNSTSYAMPIMYKPPLLEEASTNLVDTRAKCLPDPTSYTIKPEDVVTQNNSPIIDVTTTIVPNESNDHTDNTKTDHTKTTTDVVNETHSRFNDIKSPLKNSSVITSLPPVSNTHMIKCLSPMEMFFKNLLNYFAEHRCKSPAFVFLQIEPQPPWEPCDLRYNTMILEDKDRFQEGSIDTCMCMKTNMTS